MTQGWIKFHREYLDNPTITKDAEHLAVWVYLLTKARFNKKEVYFSGEKIEISAGQLHITCKEIYEYLKIDRNKLTRILKSFKNEHLIEQQTNNHKTLITLARWAFYQGINEQPSEQQMSNQRATEQETEKEKEKRSKREKEKEKELYKELKNSRSVCIGENTHERTSFLPLGKYENVFADKEWLEDFKSKYWYYDSVIESLSTYKAAKGIVNSDDRPYLELFANQDKDKYVKESSTFDADDFFEAALKRTYGDLMIDTADSSATDSIDTNSFPICAIENPSKSTEELDDEAFLEKAKRDFWKDLF